MSAANSYSTSKSSATLGEALAECREFKLEHRAHTKAYDGFARLEYLLTALSSETVRSKAEINAEIIWAAWQTAGGMDPEEVLNLISTEFQWKLPK